jgi:hypothetical protein
MCAYLIAFLRNGVERGHAGCGGGHQLLGWVDDGVVVSRHRHDLQTAEEVD